MWVDSRSCQPIEKGRGHEALRFLINARTEFLEAYKKYHAAVWPEVLAMIRRCNIRNYSIYLKDDLHFGYFEYHGAEYAADMAKMAADPKTQEWWAIMMPMQKQKPLETCAPGER